MIRIRVIEPDKDSWMDLGFYMSRFLEYRYTVPTVQSKYGILYVRTLQNR